LKPYYQQSFCCGTFIRLEGDTDLRSLFSRWCFLHQHAQTPTKATDYDLVPFGKLVPISHGIPDFGGILDFALRIDIPDNKCDRFRIISASPLDMTEGVKSDLH
jgi:hypothetical protein